MNARNLSPAQSRAVELANRPGIKAAMGAMAATTEDLVRLQGEFAKRRAVLDVPLRVVDDADKADAEIKRLHRLRAEAIAESFGARSGEAGGQDLQELDRQIAAAKARAEKLEAQRAGAALAIPGLRQACTEAAAAIELVAREQTKLRYVAIKEIADALMEETVEAFGAAYAKYLAAIEVGVRLTTLAADANLPRLVSHRAAPPIHFNTMWPVANSRADGYVQFTGSNESFQAAGEFVDELLVALDVIKSENKQ